MHKQLKEVDSHLDKVQEWLGNNHNHPNHKRMLQLWDMAKYLRESIHDHRTNFFKDTPPAIIAVACVALDIPLEDMYKARDILFEDYLKKAPPGYWDKELDACRHDVSVFKTLESTIMDMEILKM